MVEASFEGGNISFVLCASFYRVSLLPPCRLALDPRNILFTEDSVLFIDLIEAGKVFGFYIALISIG